MHELQEENSKHRGNIKQLNNLCYPSIFNWLSSVAME